ncbi:MAG: hypothetical protein GY870_08595, partial [archaeon]|nr:hypothetical protein [archaeon]
YVEFIGTWSVTNYQNQSIDLSFLNTINDLDIIEKYDSIATTQTLSFFPHELFTRLIQLSTSETDTSKLFYSILFGRTDSEFELYPANGNGALDAVTSVWEIRNFPDKPFNVSIRDLFKSFDSIYSIGLSYDRANERFYIESKSEFYNSSSQMFELTDVKNFVRKPYKTGYFSEIKNGINKKIEYEEIQGANEYNLNNEKTVSIPIKTTLDAQQVYNTDSIGIELPRRKQYTTNANEDTRYDENICIIRTDGTEAIQNGTSVTGFIGVDEMYNVKLTPRENLIRWGGVIKSCLWKSSEDIKQILSQKNVNINYTNRQGNNVNELDDINQSELTDQRLFNPEIYEFESAITLEILNTLDSDPHGYVRVTFNEIVYEGFVLEMQTKDYDRKATWKLLAKGVDEIVDVDNYVFENDDNYTFENDDNYIFNN